MAARTTGKIRTESWLKRTLQTPSEAEVFRARAPPQGRLEVTNELGSFYRGEQPGGGGDWQICRRTRRRSRWSSPSSIKERSNRTPPCGRELTTDTEELKKARCTLSSAPPRWGPPLVDEDWPAICQATYKGVEGAEWENLLQQIRGDGQGSRRPSSKWKQQG